MGYAPNFITYECIIMMYGCDCVSKARGMYGNMIGTEKHLKVSTLNTMLNVYCLNSLPVEADKSFETACNSGMFRINSLTYKLLYKSYTKANMTDLIQKLLKHVDRDGIVPNKRFFLEALGALGSSRANQDAILLLLLKLIQTCL
ncbi:putative pentatricopeptide repeat-containing protein PPR5 [Helianthus annuus]|nr:putative pentatricopeptide repeat-containing protein PPR5 [Helianthus annuus]